MVTDRPTSSAFRYCQTTLILAAIAGCISTGLPNIALAGEKRSAPNVVIILADDQGYGDMSCHGHPLLKTPNMDKLHDESVRLIDFHVAPMCSPTRGQLMTGVDCLRNGAMATCLGRHLPRPELPMMPGFFAASGYKTGLFGKWHLGNTYPYRPTDRGFQEAVTFHGFGLVSADEYWHNDYFDFWYVHNNERVRAKGYCTDFFFDRAMDWMQMRRDRGEPFFVYLPTNAPHFPHWVDEKYRKPYGDSPLAPFYGQLANLDENLGRFDQFLRRGGLYENTIVIYASDNGHAGGGKNPFNAGMKGGKCARYDGGHRVPCFIRWPAGKLKAPGDIVTPAQVQDLLPTLVELCGLKNEKHARFDGTSLAGLLRGAKLPDRMFVMQYYQNSVAKDDAAVIWNQWRLVYGKELYDIKADPRQVTNVAEKHPDVVAAMQTFYGKWWAGVTPKIDELSPLYVGAEAEPTTVLTCCEWQGVRSDGAESVLKPAEKDAKGGPWNVQVQRAGTYEIELRRWPREADLALDAGAPEFKGRVGTIIAGQAFPIVWAELEVDGKSQCINVKPGDKAATFTVPLKAGRVSLHGRFIAALGQPLCGAFYAYVTLKDPESSVTK